ncbi:hypothetical protein V1525DRAFT_456181 [Lipomyces kononenkoae]|uniref:Uncharacterized protein n=1 Tax=Lipomyces kononenkoae TaxID=34357 RepID=A0ACC3T2B4_LIPKO
MKLIYAFVLFYAIVSVTAWNPFSYGTPEYNTWDTKQLAKWLHDNKIKYLSSSSRDDLLGLVKENWDVVTASPGPFAKWSDERLVSYLNKKGVEVADSVKTDHDWLISKAHKQWETGGYDTEDTYTNAKDWIFDSWSESALKKFLDEHHFGSSAAATKDALLKKVKDNYDYIARSARKKSDDTSDWLFDAWSDSDLADWLVSHGYNVPKKRTRKDLIRLVKKYSFEAAQRATLAKDRVQTVLQNFREDMVDAAGQVKDSAFDSWSDSDLKAWLDEHGVPVPQPSKRDELIALARKNKHQLKEDWEVYRKQAQESYEAAAKMAAGTKESVEKFSSDAFKQLTSTWPDFRLEEFLRSRGFIVPEKMSTKELQDLIWQNRKAPITAYDSWSFYSWSMDDLQDWLKEQGNTVTGTRDQLADRASKYFKEIKAEGGDKYQQSVMKIREWYNSGKDMAFDKWSDSDLKAYLDSYGVPVYQGSTRNELIAAARRHTGLFRHGAHPEGWSETLGKANAYLKTGLWSAASGTKKLSEKVQQQVSESLKKLRSEL